MTSLINKSGDGLFLGFYIVIVKENIAEFGTTLAYRELFIRHKVQCNDVYIHGGLFKITFPYCTFFILAATCKKSR